MTNREHCRATRILLGTDPHRDLHRYMDAYSSTMGWAHRLMRHDLAFVERVAGHYGEEGGLVAALHVACDCGVVTNTDVNIFSRKRISYVC